MHTGAYVHAGAYVQPVAMPAVKCSINQTQWPQASTNVTRILHTISGMYQFDAAGSPGLPLPASHLMS